MSAILLIPSTKLLRMGSWPFFLRYNLTVMILTRDMMSRLASGPCHQ